MGLQDRDYYRDRYRNSASANKQARKSTVFKYLLFPALTLAALWYGADILLKNQNNGSFSIPAPVISTFKEPDATFIPSGIVLKTDRQGHFRGTVFINGIPMPFLIDTGATKTVLPTQMAIDAGLPFGQAVQASTAGGKVFERLTRIDRFKIGNAEVRNLDANINEHLDEVLIGMNTLKYFRMVQNGNTLTLEANNQRVNPVANAQVATFDSFPAQPAVKKPAIVKKKVICDERQVCKTIYSDH